MNKPHMLKRNDIDDIDTTNQLEQLKIFENPEFNQKLQPLKAEQVKWINMNETLVRNLEFKCTVKRYSPKKRNCSLYELSFKATHGTQQIRLETLKPQLG